MKERFSYSVFTDNCNDRKKIALAEYIGEGKFREMTYEEFFSRVESAAVSFSREKHISEKERVLLLHPFSADLYITLTALLSLGATVTFIEPWMGRKLFSECVKTVSLKSAYMRMCDYWIFRILGYLNPSVKNISLPKDNKHKSSMGFPEIDAETEAIITYSSGSGGSPKPVVRRYGDLTRQFRRLSKHIPKSDSADLITFPNLVLFNLGRGGTTVLPPRDFNGRSPMKNDFLRAFSEKYFEKRMFLSSSHLESIDPRFLSSFKRIFTGGSVVLPGFLKRRGIESKTTVFYGSTEIEPIAVNENPGDASGSGVCAGKIDDEILLKIEDSDEGAAGDISVSEDGGESFIKTGDVGYIEKEGMLFLMGRKIDSPVISGRRIYQYEIFRAADEMGLNFKAAAVEDEGRLICVYEGESNADNAERLFGKIGFKCEKTVFLKNFPMDSRHRSKIDYLKLKILVKAASFR